MNRVELKVRRRAELRVFDVVKTQWIDDIEELQHYRNLRIERVQKALDERKITAAKMDAPFKEMFDECGQHENEITLARHHWRHSR